MCARVVILLCAFVIVYVCLRRTYTPCALVHIYICFLFKRKKMQIVCVFSSLHAQTHLTKQQMAVCHQSVDSSCIFPWKESQQRELRVQMAVYSATSHPQSAMKESPSCRRTPSRCLPWHGYIHSHYSKSF